jgi:hypothetical protein
LTPVGLASEILAREHREESIIARLAAQGVATPRRPDASPEAIFRVSFNEMLTVGFVSKWLGL